MGQCYICKEFIWPDFMVPGKDDDKLCIFCVRERDEVEVTSEHGPPKIISKADAVNSYKKFIVDFKRKKDIKNIVEDGAKIVDLN